jgi:MOSC domain-containing protein YiiM
MSDEHRVLRLWVRHEKLGPMIERESLELLEGEGVREDHTCGVEKRHVTLVFREDWREAEDELGRAVDPAGRRANVLLGGGGGEAFVGQTVDLGEVRLRVLGITRPCHVMERAAPGLQAALGPGARAGVWGQIDRGGTVRTGDVLARATTTERHDAPEARQAD